MVRDSKLTASVDLLDRLVRFAPNLTQKLFEPHATVPRTVALPSAYKNAPLRVFLF